MHQCQEHWPLTSCRLPTKAASECILYYAGGHRWVEGICIRHGCRNENQKVRMHRRHESRTNGFRVLGLGQTKYTACLSTMLKSDKNRSYLLPLQKEQTAKTTHGPAISPSSYRSSTLNPPSTRQHPSNTHPLNATTSSSNTRRHPSLLPGKPVGR